MPLEDGPKYTPEQLATEADKVETALWNALETAIKRQNSSFYRLSMDTGIDQSALSKAKKVDRRTGRRKSTLLAPTLLKIMLYKFEPQLRKFVSEVEFAARKSA